MKFHTFRRFENCRFKNCAVSSGRFGITVLGRAKAFLNSTNRAPKTLKVILFLKLLNFLQVSIEYYFSH